MNAEQLKNSILQRAIEGKLVEQREEEGTAAELLREIKAEKARLVKEGKLKKEKPLRSITAEEIPFEIPESWEWVRLGEISTYGSNKLKISPRDITPEMWTLDMEDIEKESGRIIHTEYAKNRTIAGDKIIFHKGEILYSKLRPYLKKVLVAPADGICTSELVPFQCYANINAKYITYYLRSPYVTKIVNAASYGVKMPRVNKETMINLPVPLPPLAEQKRIVAKIEKLLPHVEQYGKAHDELTALNEKFPDAMKKSVLQYAMEGRLVEQREEEGTAKDLLAAIKAEKARLVVEGKLKKEKPLPEIKAEEIPFEIPESWEWVRLGEIIQISSGDGLTSKDMTNGNIPVFGGNGITGYHNVANITQETVVIGRVGFYCGSVHITPAKAWVTDNAFITTYPKNNIDRNYLVYILRHMNLGRNRNATAQPVVSGKKIYPILFPLPPLAEQKRIVAKIEELLACCGALEKA